MDLTQAKMKKLTELRKQLTKNGYRLVKSGKSEYKIIDKYNNVTKDGLSLFEVEWFLTNKFEDYCYKVSKGKIPPLERKSL